ncbi:MAG: dephospho-CoA kinase, partial [Actinomycetota bacterium]|nr:dephospho-CoA kinase [Actinomycetota bacterium]
GEEILNPDKTINRAALGQIVFNSERQLAKLEAITHPGINKRLFNILERQTSEITILDMAVLVEQPLAQIDGAPLYQKVIVVEASYENRIERLQMRGLTTEDAHARMQSQATDKERRLVADLVIRNDNSLQDLKLEIFTCWEIICDWMNE